MALHIREIDLSQLYLIKALWEKLNQLHKEDSRFFKEHYATFTFEKRCEKFFSKESQNVRIEIVELNKSNVIGYCISTISNNIGEVESLFIEKKYRHIGYGKVLVCHAVEWFKNRNCTKIQVAVAEGHESVFDFYMKQGFYPRLTYLELKE